MPLLSLFFDHCALATTLLPLLSRWLLGLLFALLLTTSPARAALLSDVAAPQLFFRSGEHLSPASLRHSHIDMTIRGTLASATLTQEFRNNGDDWLNAVYVTPLPDGAAVYGWEVDFGDRRIVGVVKEKAAARLEYQQALTEGRRAALVETIDGGLFRVDIGNIDPHTDIAVRLTMNWPVSVTGRQFEVRFPTTITPRYAPEKAASEPDLAGVMPYVEPSTGHAEAWFQGLTGAVEAEHLAGQPVVPMAREVRFPLSWRVDLQTHAGLALLQTPLHNSEFSGRRQAFTVVNRGDPAEMDRDWVLRWALTESAQPSAAVNLEHFDGDWYGHLEIIEPSNPGALVIPPRDLILVVDVSGSMAGESMRQARAAVHTALTTLRPQDTVNILAFDHRVMTLFPSPRHAAPDVLKDAHDFVDGMTAEGGTEMAPALHAALVQAQLSQNTSSVGDGSLSQILFLTDGAVFGEEALFKLIADGLGDVRMSTVAIGPAPNSAFMRRAAALGRGLHQQIARIEDVQPVLEHMLKAMAMPVLTDLFIDWPLAVEEATLLPPDLYTGESVSLLVRFSQAPQGGVVTVRGLLEGWPWQRDLVIPSGVDHQQGDGVLARLWAREKIQAALDDATLSGMGIEVARSQVLPLALRFGLVTPFSSLLAQELSRARPPERQIGAFRLPTATPTQQFDFPRTGTAASLWLYFGLLGIFMGVLCIAMGRDDPGINHKQRRGV